MGTANLGLNAGFTVFPPCYIPRGFQLKLLKIWKFSHLFFNNLNENFEIVFE